MKAPAWPIFTVYAKLHLAVAAVLLGLVALLDPLWQGLRLRAYAALDSPRQLERALGAELNPEVASLLSLILPHGLNNTAGFTLSLAKVIRSGALANLCIAAIALASRLIVQREKRAARMCISLLLACDVSVLIVGVSGLIWGMSSNIKIPQWPFSVWPDVIGTVLATSRVYPVTREKWAHVDLGRLTSADLSSLQRLSDLKGLYTLHQIFSGSYLSFLSNSTDLSIIVLAFFGLFAADVLPLVLKLRALITAWPAVRAVRPYKRIMLGPFVYFFVTLGIAALFLVQYPSCTMSDTFEHLGAASSTGHSYLLFTKSIQGSSPDVRISADVFVPPRVLSNLLNDMRSRNATSLFRHGHENLTQTSAAALSPTFFSATRYNRRMTLRWPFTGLKVWSQQTGDNSAAIFTWPLTRGLVSEDIPLVVMDARGTGASSGSRLVDLDEHEVEDFRIVASWAKRQAWSDGVLAGGGVSYDGLTSLKLAAVSDSPLDMTVAMFSPLHPVSDLMQNNGMASRAFVDDYSAMTAGFERQGSPLLHWLMAEVVHIPVQIKLGFLFAFRLPLPARGWEETVDRDTLRASRESNWDMKRIADSTMFLDDKITLNNGQQLSAVDGGVNQKDLAAIVARRIPTYWSAGECDSTGVRRAESIFAQLDHTHTFHRLVIGPWGHGGRRGCGTEPHEGSWACAELQGMRDMAHFVKTAANHILQASTTGTGTAVEDTVVSTVVDTDPHTTNDGLHHGDIHTNTQQCPVEPPPELSLTMTPKGVSMTQSLTQSKTVSSRYGYISSRDGGWWQTRVYTGSSQPPFKTGLTLSLGSDLVPAEWVDPRDVERVDIRASLALAHLLAVPRSLLKDLRVHIPRRDLAGAAHDLSEILMILGGRLNRVLHAGKVLVGALLTGRSSTESVNHSQSSTATSMNMATAGSVRSDVPVATDKSVTSDGAVASDNSVASETAVPFFRILDKAVSGEFATTGSLSRWSIVQHLMRFPVDSDHSLACSATLRRLIDRVRGRSSTIFEFVTAPLSQDVLVEGPLRLQLPFLVEPGDMARNAYVDWAVVAVLQEEVGSERTYVSEGRALVSLRAGGGAAGDRLLANVTAELPAALAEGLPFRADFEDDAKLSRAHFLPPETTHTHTLLLFVRFQLEAANRLIRRGSKLRLTLLPEDQTNFPWKRTAQKMSTLVNNPVKQLTRWRIPIMPTAKHAGWLHLP